MPDILDNLFSTIEQLTKKVVGSTPMDLTVEGEIKLLSNVEIGEYKVLYQGNTFSAFSLDPEIVYQTGNKVYVLVPQGNFSAQKIILGRTASSGNITATERQEMQNQYIPIGPNWVEEWYPTQQPMEITTVPEADKDMLVHPVANWEDVGFIRALPAVSDAQTRYSAPLSAEQLNWADAQLQTYATTLDTLLISADFRTEFNSVHDHGDYHLAVECIVANPLFLPIDHPDYDPGQEQYQLVSFELGFGQFIGAPYEYIVNTPNKGVYSITPGQLKGLHKISLVQDGTFVTDLIQSNDPVSGLPVYTTPNYTKNNIFVSNVDIRFARKADLNDSLYYCYIATPYGNAVYNPDATSVPPIPTGKNSVDLIAKLRYGYQDILSKETCEVFWYRQDYSVTISDERFDKRAGIGWCPIDSLTDQQDAITAGTPAYEIDFDTLTVPKEMVSWKWKYKCVVIYNEEVFNEAEETVSFTNSPYNLTIQQFISADSKQTLLRIKDWNDLNPNTGDPVREWHGIWRLALPDGSYRQITDKVQGPIVINEYLLNEVATFKVEAFHPDHIAELPRANLELTITSSEDGDLHIEWVGKDTFTYDANGSVKWEAAAQEHTLFAKLNWLEGKASDYRIEMLAPDGSILGSEVYYGDSVYGRAYNLENSMMQDMWVDNNNVIHYHIKEKFDTTKTANTYTMRIFTYRTGETYELTKTIQFIKDGAQGTQGSDWIAPIWPTNRVPGAAVQATDFTQPVTNRPTPLVRGTDGNWENDDYRLYLRPFVSKNGVRIEEMDPHEGYWYKVSWDVRYPARAYSETKYSSWLRLSPPNLDLPNYYPETRAETNPPNQPGLAAETQYSGRLNEYFSTVRVSGIDNAPLDSNGNPITGTPEEILALNNYNFIVRATIEIYQGTYEENPAGLNSNGIYTGSTNTASSKLISTIYSIYPVDILWKGQTAEDVDFWAGEEFDANQVVTNWPQYVDYDAAGYNPNVFEDDLYFRYGPEAKEDITGLGAAPNNLTETVQTLEESLRNRNEWNEYVSYKYRPRPYFNVDNLFYGALVTRSLFGDSPNTLYYRNQIMRLNNYSNSDINGWDGQGIDLNEEKGTILAATVGAGYKDPFTNTFTGVIMGVDTSHLKPTDGRIPSSENDVSHNRYMTGIYGYQEGYSSFGIMENGTAFFGRADKGGRIIIDGNNAQIYGGSGVLETGFGADMKDKMRLTLLDFSQTPPVPGGTIDTVDVDGNNFNPYEFHFSLADSNPAKLLYPNWDADYTFIRNSTTITLPAMQQEERRRAMSAAIEIGQYDPTTFIVPSFTKGQFKNLSELEIPGNRRFLVTYDGTLYAMNAFVKGTIVGSTIVGSHFLNADGTFEVHPDGWLGVGQGEGNFVQYTINYGKWSSTVPPAPTQTPLTVNKGYAFFVTEGGVVYCKNIHVSGGELHIGHFHIEETGNMIHFGTTTLVGPDSGDGRALRVWGESFFYQPIVNQLGAFLGSRDDPSETSINHLDFPLWVDPGRSGLKAEIGLWPLYANIVSSTKAWISLSDGGSGAVPSFTPEDGDLYTITGVRPIFRTGSQGTWVSNLLMTSTSKKDDEEFTFLGAESDVDGIFGYFQTAAGFDALGLRLVKSNLNMAFEGMQDVRLSGTNSAFLQADHISSPAQVGAYGDGRLEMAATARVLLRSVPDNMPSTGTLYGFQVNPNGFLFTSGLTSPLITITNNSIAISSEIPAANQTGIYARFG